MSVEKSFDTELTLLYKLAEAKSVPVELFILRQDDEGNVIIEPLYDFVKAYDEFFKAYEEELKLDKLWTEAKDFYTLAPKDQFPLYLAFIYLLYRFPDIAIYASDDLPEGEDLPDDFKSLILEIVKLYTSEERVIPGIKDPDLYVIETDESTGEKVKIFFDPPKYFVIEEVVKQYRHEMGLLLNPERDAYKSTMTIANEVIDLHENISSRIRDPLARSPIYKTSESIVYNMVLTEEFDEDGEGETYVSDSPIDIQDGFHIFDSAELSESVPFIQYNTPNKSYYKIFRGTTVDTTPQYKNILVPPEEKTEANTIYLKVWVIHPSKKAFEPMHLSEASKFIKVVISLEKAEIKFDIPNIKNNSLVEYLDSIGDKTVNTYGVRTVSEWVIIDSLYNALPREYRLSERREEDVKAEILIYQAYMDRTSLSYEVFFGEILKRFLYIDENANPQSLQHLPNENKIRLRYAPFPINHPDLPKTIKNVPYITTRIISATIEQDFTKPGETSEVYESDYENEQFIIKRKIFDTGTPYFRINVSRTGDTKAIEEFLDTFTYLVPIYMEVRPEITSYYSKFLLSKEYKDLFPSPPKPKSQHMVFDAKIALKGLEGSGVTRHGFTSKNRASAIFRDYIPEWVKMTFNYRNHSYHREVIPFPRPEATEFGTVLLIRFKDGEVSSLIRKNPLSSGVKGELVWISFDEMVTKIDNGDLNEPEIWSTCPLDKESSFIGVSVNRNKKTKDIYEYLPICSANPQTNMTLEGRKPTGFQIYYLDLEEVEITSRGSNLDRPDKICRFRQLGAIPNEIENKVLNQYPDKKDGSRFYRYGVPISPNSFLHSILVALQDPVYFSLESLELKEAYVKRVRKFIAARVYPGLLKQSLYDRSLGEIWSMLCDVDNFFDPSIYYRAVEEVFGVNVFVYNQETMVLPRHKAFHVQPYRKLQTILILKHLGEDTANLKYPQSELIIENVVGSENISIFSSSMGKINYDVLQALYKVYTWKISNTGDLEIYQNREIQGKRYTEPDYSEIIDHKGRYQIIDDYGKMRGLIFRGSKHKHYLSTSKGKERVFEDDEGETEDVTMVFSPSQPVNLPLSTKERLILCEEKERDDYEEEEEEDLPRCSYDTAVNIFGEISSITKTPDNSITGLWFGKYLKVYVPINPIRNPDLLSFPEGEPNPFEVKKDDSVQRLNKMKKDLDIIQQVFWWLYTLYVKDILDGKTLFTKFISSYVSFDNYEGDSAKYYDLLEIPRIFPTVDNVGEGIQKLSKYQEESDQLDTENENGNQPLFDDGKIRFYNESFYEKMVMWLKKKVMLSKSNKDLLKIPKSIQNFYNSPKDFYSQPNVTIFIGTEELKKWLNSIEMEKSIYKIHKKITPDLSLSKEPFILQDSEDDKIYYIQNVAGGSKARALNVGKKWAVERINSGWMAPPIIRDYPHIIYGDVSDVSSKTSIFKIIEDNRRNKERFKLKYSNIPVILSADGIHGYLRLLQYNTTPPVKYAAMLELF